MTRLRRSAALLAASIAALAFAGGVQAKSFDFPQANVQVVVQADGSLLVTERLTYAFSGSFSGGEPRHPLRSGESIDQVSVLENGRPFATGRLRRDRMLEPGWDVRRRRGRRRRERIVWHFSARTRCGRSRSATGCEASRSRTTTSST